MRGLLIAALTVFAMGALALTGCRQKAVTPQAQAREAGPADAKVFIRAFYPGNEKHKVIGDYLMTLVAKYPGEVRARFVPFDSDEGFNEWQAAGLTCGGILINGQQTFTVKKEDGKTEEVTLKMFWDGEWTKGNLDAIVADEVAKAYPK